MTRVLRSRLSFGWALQFRTGDAFDRRPRARVTGSIGLNPETSKVMTRYVLVCGDTMCDQRAFRAGVIPPWRR